MLPEPKVHVVDDNDDFRSSLQWLLESVDLDVACYPSADAFVEACDPRVPGCLILDIRMPGMSGIELQGRLRELGAEMHIIFLTGHANVKTAVQVMRDGAVDLLEKPIDEQRLIDRVQQVLKQIRERLQVQRQLETVAARLALLTPREREVLDLVVSGKRTKVVAAELGLSTKTVDAHRANIMEKMRVHSVAELVSTVMEAQAAGVGPRD